MKRKKNTEAVLTPDPYLGFLQSMALQGVGLDSTSATVDRTALAEAISANEAGELALDANFGVLLNSAEFLVTVGAFKLTQLHRKDSEKPLLMLECSFSAMFQHSQPVDSATAERFANTEAKLIFWPYLRHFVADTTYRMAITPVLLPLITSTGTSAPSAQKQ